MTPASITLYSQNRIVNYSSRSIVNYGANATTPAVVEEFPPPYVFVEVMRTWPTWGSMGSTGHSKFNLFFRRG